jgi:threonine dehydratase
MTIGDSAAVPAPDSHTTGELIAHADLDGASRAIRGTTVRTPTLACAELTERAGTPVMLKAECLQVTGSFKLRGALSKVAALGPRVTSGLVTASAGNHARAVAQAARSCTRSTTST